MNKKFSKISYFLFLFLPVIAYAQAGPNLRDKVIEETLYAMEEKFPDTEIEENIIFQDTEASVAYSPDKSTYLAFDARFGYLTGMTSYDFNHHTSELEFPMDNIMGGGNIALGYKDLSLSAEVWAPLEDNAGSNMKDKDWDGDGVLSSYTKSKAYMDAIIWDISLRYDFFKKRFFHDEEDSALWEEDLASRNEIKIDALKIGALLGYKYERFGYEMYDLYYPDLGIGTYDGVKIGTYKIKYHVPYFGVAVDLAREKFGLGFNFNYSFWPTAKDLDNHVLRYLTFYGDYNKNGQAILGSLYGFWKFMKNWKLKAGAEATFIRIDGKTWEANHDPGWDADQSVDSRQWLYWSGVEYRF